MKNILPVLIGILIPFGSLSAQLGASINDSTNLSCFESMDGTATVSISGSTGPFEILWDDDSLTTLAIATDLIAERWYRVTVTDAAFAEVKDSVMLSQPDEIIYELGGLKTIQCYGPSEGFIKISSSGGAGPHDYTWSGEITSDSDSVYNLTAGKYYFLITDSTGCTQNDSLTLEEADKVLITYDSIFPNPCLGQAKGEIYVSAEGGQSPYEYLWTGPTDFTSTSQDITGLMEGQYCLDLTDARGCVYERDTSMVDGDPITVTYSVSEFRDFNLVCYGDSSGSIAVDTVAGNGLDWKNYTYIWNGPGGYKEYTHEISDLKAGNYHLNVFDSLNCR
ncbi:MAG: SprB repeat-containing protein, partial [Bacteroidales bacterium]|nr:SprB repeat-containing protein [Bacteroidales bacterium]